MKEDKTKWNIEKIGAYYQEQAEKQERHAIIKNAFTNIIILILAPCLFITLVIIGLGKKEE